MVEVERMPQDELLQNLRTLFQPTIRLTLEMVLEEEVKALVGARRFERAGSRQDHRSGTFRRRLLTSLGQIAATTWTCRCWNEWTPPQRRPDRDATE